ncbi:hypothetical protein DSCW_48460 [Desulfosarcina widdelii]|uniref:Uncharacterized protein n=1 Tax=Desulfosarcina widdelii TaxID=947919 RepID=A0A5K7ZB76_9BACT|nr:hypothetical protein [Desulfosarcina widdelii]BBO77429.1 hypothetical protein DSCW_48460 [Desulfosarcina widdelii]
MKKYNSILFNMFLISFVFFFTDAVAEQRMITFEMGESGQTVSFPMSQEEIAYADSVTAYSNSFKKADDTMGKDWVNRIELPESGQFVEFPMTEEEIQEAKEKAAKEKSNINRRKLNEPNVRGSKAEIVEMADGYTIVFYDDKPAKWGYYPIQ